MSGDRPTDAPGLSRWPLALAALVLLGVAGWLAKSVYDEAPPSTDPPLAALPEPRPPRASPMVATGGGYGWTWVNPIPRAMPTWYALDAGNDGTKVVLVGRAGAAVRYEEGSLYALSSGTDVDLRGVAFLDRRTALAAGERGTLVLLSPEGPRAIASGVEVTLRDVVVAPSGGAIVVGDRGTILRVRALRASVAQSGEGTDLLAACRRGEDVFVVGSEGTVLRLSGDTIARESSGTDRTLRAVGGCRGGEVYAAGDEGTLLRRRRSGEWTQVSVSSREAFTALSCDHGRIAASRRDGSVLLANGAQTVELASGFDRAWHAVGGGMRGPSWIAGAGGRLATIEIDHVRTRTAGPTVPIRALGGMGGALIAVGEWGRILRERENGIAQVESPTEAGLASLIQIDDSHLIAVGDYGAIVEIRFDGASLVASPTHASLRDGVAEGQSVLVVGAAGHVLRGTIDALEDTVVDVGDLWSVAGTPSDAIVVGDGGIVLRIREGRIAQQRCRPNVNLEAVLRVAEGTWAVGQLGTIIRIDETQCTIEHEGGPFLRALGIGPEGRLLAAGDDGVVLSRGDDGHWTQAGVDVGRASIRAIWRSDRYVYLAGSDGVIVRHIRVDGG